MMEGLQLAPEKMGLGWVPGGSKITEPEDMAREPCGLGICLNGDPSLWRPLRRIKMGTRQLDSECYSMTLHVHLTFGILYQQDLTGPMWTRSASLPEKKTASLWIRFIYIYIYYIYIYIPKDSPDTFLEGVWGLRRV